MFGGVRAGVGGTGNVRRIATLALAAVGALAIAGVAALFVMSRVLYHADVAW